MHVAEGKAWHKDTLELPDSVIAFSPGGSSHPGFFNESMLDASGDAATVGASAPRTSRLAPLGCEQVVGF